MASPQARTGTLEEGQVRAMFDRIARVYDLMNSLMTAGLHHRWRERAADLAAVGPGGRALDVASGTGDLAIELARRVGPTGTVIGSDFSEAMLDRARQKSSADQAPMPVRTSGVMFGEYTVPKATVKPCPPERCPWAGLSWQPAQSPSTVR